MVDYHHKDRTADYNHTYRMPTDRMKDYYHTKRWITIKEIELWTVVIETEWQTRVEW